ncbi:MAG: DNA alkylation repair protein [Campylobacteraceae bacterium]|jgi:3-methyladenine DNA glycosylase AlkD|nr:DNA alkylation repair protein [Campylobacteraceae bacterium]
MPKIDAQNIISELLKYANDAYALHHVNFFKCFEGGYGDINDTFCGINAGNLRLIAKKFYDKITLDETAVLLKERLHDARAAALVILVYKFDKALMSEKEQIVKLYLKHTKYINNWDLVDISVYKILGRYAYETKECEILRTLSRSGFLWEERMSVVANWYLIHKGEFALILELCEKFLTHKHDLMHKACGWMLREMGKVSDDGYANLLKFLETYRSKMPRTMLRYAIERLSIEQKAFFMKR